jgi:hypothetical protein
MNTLNFTVTTAVSQTDNSGVTAEAFKEEIDWSVDPAANDHMPVAVLIGEAISRAYKHLGWSIDNPEGGSVSVSWKLKKV